MEMNSYIFKSFIPIQFVVCVFWSTSKIMKISNFRWKMLILYQIISKSRFSNTRKKLYSNNSEIIIFRLPRTTTYNYWCWMMKFRFRFDYFSSKKPHFETAKIVNFGEDELLKVLTAGSQPSIWKIKKRLMRRLTSSSTDVFPSSLIFVLSVLRQIVSPISTSSNFGWQSCVIRFSIILALM